MRDLASTVAALAALSLLLAVLARPASAGDEYSTATKQPCISCHTSSASGALNARGAAFAAVERHRAEPVEAWAEVVAAMPVEASTPGSATVLLPFAVVAAGGAAALVLVRRARR